MEAVTRRLEGGYCRTVRSEKAASRMAPAHGLKIEARGSGKDTRNAEHNAKRRRSWLTAGGISA